MTEPTVLDVTDPGAPGFADAIDRAVQTLRDGHLAVLPTDTVYGIAADAFSPAAVAGLLAAKGRGRDYPVPVLVGNPGVLAGLVIEVPDHAQRLADAFWPGGLTLIVRQSPSLAWDLGQTGGTVAVRMPDQPAILAVLQRTGPLAVSSANRHGEPPARDVARAVDQLGGDVSLYLDGGHVDSTPSTIVDCVGDRPVIVRAGGITLEQIAAVVPSAYAH